MTETEKLAAEITRVDHELAGEAAGTPKHYHLLAQRAHFTEAIDRIEAEAAAASAAFEAARAAAEAEDHERQSTAHAA